MALADNQKRIATPEERLLAHKLAEAKAAEKGWKNIADRYRETAIGSIGLDVTLVDEHDRKVISVTESDPKIDYDVAKFFADHPDQRAILERDYPKPASTRVTVSSTWVEPGQ